MPGKGLRLLIVEDQELMAMTIASVALRLNYELVGSASTAERALELVESSQPDVVLMDAQLKGAVDIVAIARVIKASARSQIVFLTGAADSESIGRMHAIKPAGIVLKPLRGTDLASKLTTAARLTALA